MEYKYEAAKWKYRYLNIVIKYYTWVNILSSFQPVLSSEK